MQERQEFLVSFLKSRRLLGLLLAASTCSAAQHQPAAEKNIILITIDTLRADHLSCYGYTRETSPNIDAFAKENLLYRECYSHASETVPAVASLLTGYFPHETKAQHNELPLPMGVVTIAERLKKNGYTTAAIISNFVLRKEAQFNQGFDFYDDDLPTSISTRKVREKTADLVTKSAIKQLEKIGREKFFLWVHYMDPHGPYTPPSPFKKKFLPATNAPAHHLRLNSNDSGTGGIPAYQQHHGRDDLDYYVSQYDGEIAFTDGNVGQLLGEIKRMGLYDNSLIIITADHGEAMGEHDYYFAHGELLYPDLIHVPLLIHWQSQTGSFEAPVQHIDVAATILEAAKLRKPNTMRGTNILDPHYRPRPVFSEMLGFRSIIWERRYLLHDSKKKLYSFFNLAIDAEQNHDLVKDNEYQKQIQPMIGMLQNSINQDFLKLQYEKPKDIDPAALEILKSLGYAQ